MILMKFSCEKTVLLEAVSLVSRAVLPKAASPVMEGILLEIYDDGRIKLIGYDLSIGIETEVPASVTKGGTFVVNAKMFGDLLRCFENDTVFFETDEHLNLTMRCCAAQFIIGCIAADTFPTLPVIEEEKSIQIRQDMLHSMLRQTLFAVSDNDTTPMLKGILFSIRSDSIELVATNQFKLAVRKEPFVYNGEPLQFIVPGKTVAELIRAMPQTDDLVSIYLEEKQIVFEMKGLRVISRLLSGQFLNYRDILPLSFKTIATVRIDPLRRSMERASVLVSTEKVRVPVRFSFEFDSLVLSCRSSTGNTMTDEIPAKVDGQTLEIGFNNRYVLELLAAAECDEVVLGLNQSNSLMKVTPTDSEKFIFLLSPMRLRE